MAVSILFPLVNLSVEPTTGTFARFDEKTSLYALFASSGDQILTKIIKYVIFSESKKQRQKHYNCMS